MFGCKIYLNPELFSTKEFKDLIFKEPLMNNLFYLKCFLLENKDHAKKKKRFKTKFII